MRLYFLLSILLFLLGCIRTPEVLVSEEVTIEKMLQHNKSEAKEAKEAYLKLQKKRK